MPNNDVVALARQAIGGLLDGSAPDYTTSDELGPYTECYVEMCHAFEQGGTAAGRKVFSVFAERDPRLAALRSTQPNHNMSTWSVPEILAAEFTRPNWLVEGLVPRGLTILAGRPKTGKSWLALQIAAAIGTGGEVFGRKVEYGTGLYLALEDNLRRLQQRIQQQGVPATARVNFCDTWAPLSDTGIDLLKCEIARNGYSLVIIDTASRALGSVDQMDQAEMNVVYGDLQRLAFEHEMAILVLDHHRKTSAANVGNVIDDVMGATSKAGVADATMGMYRDRGKKFAVLKIVGRDMGDQEITLEWDSSQWKWQVAADVNGIKAESVQSQIVTAIEERGGRATATQIAHFLGKHASNIMRELGELQAKHLIIREEKRGREVPYSLALCKHDNNDNNDIDSRLPA